MANALSSRRVARYSAALSSYVVPGKRHEMAELAKLVMERAPEKIAVRDVERAVAESVIRAGKGNDPLFAGGQHGGFERGFDGFEAGIGENDFAATVSSLISGAVAVRPDFVHRSKVMRLNSRASSALRAWGCTSPIAWGSRASCLCPAFTTRGLA